MSAPLPSVPPVTSSPSSSSFRSSSYLPKKETTDPTHHMAAAQTRRHHPYRRRLVRPYLRDRRHAAAGWHLHDDGRKSRLYYGHLHRPGSPHGLLHRPPRTAHHHLCVAWLWSASISYASTAILKSTFGDLLVFFCAIFFALHILVIDHFLLKKAHGIKMSWVQFAIAFLFSATLTALFESSTARFSGLPNGLSYTPAASQAASPTPCKSSAKNIPNRRRQPSS